MRFTKKVAAIVMAAVVTAGSVVATAPQKADAAGVTAYLCFQSKSFHGARDEHSASTHSLGVFDGKTNKSIAGVKVKNATIKKGKFTVTVSVTGKNLKNFQGDKGWNTIFVDTTLAGTKKSSLKVSKAVLKMDGKTVKTIKNPVLTPDPGKKAAFTQVMIVNSYNTKYAEKKCKASSITKMPKKSMSVTITGKLK